MLKIALLDDKNNNQISLRDKKYTDDGWKGLVVVGICVTIFDCLAYMGATVMTFKVVHESLGIQLKIRSNL